MELTISKRDFLRGLSRTHAVADRKSSMPMLSNVLLTSQGTESLRLAATDLYLGVTALVIDLLERIDIEIEQAERASIGASGGYRLAQRGVKKCTVAKPGQRILAGLAR